jgi:hypothetical protein
MAAWWLWLARSCVGYVVAGLLATGCMNPRFDPDRILRITADEVAALLNREITVQEVTQRFGPPLLPYDDITNRVVLSYRLEAGKYLLLEGFGGYVIGATYDQTRIPGIRPAAHSMQVGDNVTIIGAKPTPRPGNATEVTWEEEFAHAPYFEIDGARYQSYEVFQNALRSLPKGAIVEWHVLDAQLAGAERPLSKDGEYQSFLRFCRQIGLKLVVYPGG